MSVSISVERELPRLYLECAKAFLAEVAKIERPQVVVALPGGRSVVGLLKALAELAPSSGPQAELWRRLHFFMVDERLVAPEDPDCNYTQIDKLFFQQAVRSGAISPGQLHPFVPDFSNLQASVAAYENELKRLGGNIDLVVFGVGEDGHIASLFPRHPSVLDRSPGFIVIHDSPKPPPGRMSASATLIRKSSVGFALFIGEGKRGALGNFSDPNLSIQDCPAKILDQLPRSYVFTDLD